MLSFMMMIAVDTVPSCLAPVIANQVQIYK